MVEIEGLGILLLQSSQTPGTNLYRVIQCFNLVLSFPSFLLFPPLPFLPSLSSLSPSSHPSLPPSLPPSQLYAAITEHVPPDKLNLAAGSSLLTSLKQCVVELARNSNVLETVQQAAQAVLKSGWMILLPTVSERASALSQLLPVGEGACAFEGGEGVVPDWVCTCTSTTEDDYDRL